MHQRAVPQHRLGADPRLPREQVVRLERGQYFWHSRRYPRFQSELCISRTPVRQCFRATARMPGKRAMSAASLRSNENFRYFSRARPSTALGPTFSSPVTVVVRCTPRNGRAGSGIG